MKPTRYVPGTSSSSPGQSDSRNSFNKGGFPRALGPNDSYLWEINVNLYTLNFPVEILSNISEPDFNIPRAMKLIDEIKGDPTWLRQVWVRKADAITGLIIWQGFMAIQVVVGDHFLCVLSIASQPFISVANCGAVSKKTWRCPN